MRYVYLALYTLALTCCTTAAPTAPDAGSAPADAEPTLIDSPLPACPATGAPADCTRACVCVVDGATCQAERGSSFGCH